MTRVLCSMVLLALAAVGCGGDKPAFAPAGPSDDTKKGGDADAGSQPPVSASTDASATGSSDDGDAAAANGGTPPALELGTKTVYMFGSDYWKSTTNRVIAAIDRPWIVRVMPEQVKMPAIRPSDGRLLAIQNRPSLDGSDLTRIVVLPADPSSTALEVIDSPQCAHGAGVFRIHPTTGEVLYSCLQCDSFGLIHDYPADCSDGPWYSGDDMVTTRPVLCMGRGTVLLTGAYMNSLEVYDRASDKSFPVVVPAKYASTSSPTIVAARADGKGFMVAIYFRGEDTVRWRIDATGHVTDDGAFAPMLPEYDPGIIFNADNIGYVMLLDHDGNLLQSGWSRYDFDRTVDVLVRRQLMPGKSVIAYDENNGPEFDKGQLQPRWLYMTPASTAFMLP